MGRKRPVTIHLFRPEGRGRFAAHRRQARLLQVLRTLGDWLYLCGSRLAGDEASTDDNALAQCPPWVGSGNAAQ